VADIKQNYTESICETMLPFTTDSQEAKPFARLSTAFHTSHLLKAASSSMGNAEGLN